MKRWKAACCALSSTSPVVIMNTTPAKRASDASVNTEGSSVASTSKPCRAPSAFTAATPSGMEAWRNPFVSENTSTRVPARGRARVQALAAALAPVLVAAFTAVPGADALAFGDCALRCAQASHAETNRAAAAQSVRAGKLNEVDMGAGSW